jgi:hypothetical protein
VIDKRVNIGSIGSGTNVLATAVLNFAGLRAKSSTHTVGFEASTADYAELMAMDEAELPSAIFTVSSLPSPLADHMIERHGYHLVPIEFSEAIAIEAFLQLGDPLSAGSIDKRHVFETQIPAFTYRVERAEPVMPLTTVGTRLLLVANEQVPSDVIARILDTVYGSSFARAERQPLDARLLDLPSLIQLQRELAEIKSEAVRKFAAGELEGEALINGFLALVNDSREQLTRLILHERNNIEDQAAKDEVDVDKIWTEQSK